MYKPGQLLTINGRVYRVKRRPKLYACSFCDAHNECLKLPYNGILCTGTPYYCYLQLVVPKSSLG